MHELSNTIDRREFLKALGAAAAITSLASPGLSQASPGREMLVYVGTYTSGKSKSEGIYIYKLDMRTGALTPYLTVPNVVDPSYLVIDGRAKYLYAVNETLEFEGKKSGAVSAFAIDQKTGGLTFLNKQPSLGGAPCHVVVSRKNEFVLAANYVGGNVVVLPVAKGGTLAASVDLEQQTGTGPNKDRQESAHAHSINFDRDNRFAAACDLGADKIFIYRFDAATGKLWANPEQPFLEMKPGSGPRHFVFHPNGKLAFVINELASSVTSLAYDERRGILKELQTFSTLPAGWSGENTCADLHLSPDGRFLYGSNRGHDSIASYMVDEKTGKLELIEHTSTQGKTPRNFAIDPTGTLLLAANQNSDSIVTFWIDGKTGKLRQTGNTVSVPAPVCLKLIPAFG